MSKQVREFEDDIIADAHQNSNEILEDETLESDQEESQSAESDADAPAVFIAEHGEEMSLNQLTPEMIRKAVTTLLFISDKPISLPKIKSLVHPSLEISELRDLMALVKEDLEKLNLGFELTEVAKGWMLRTRLDCKRWVLKEHKVVPIRLTPTALEVLSVIAYKQPIPKTEIDQMRSVDTSYILKNLLEKRLIKIVGRADGIGRSALFATTEEFLELLGIKSLEDLPSKIEIEQMVPQTEVGGLADEEKVKIDELVGHRTNWMEMYEKSTEDDEKALQDLKEEINSVSTSTNFLEHERKRARLRLKFEKMKTDKRQELEAQGFEPQAIDEVILANFGEEAYKVFLQEHQVSVMDGDGAIDELLNLRNPKTEEESFIPEGQEMTAEEFANSAPQDETEGF